MNVVVSSPTGSGKTVLFELAITRLFQRQIEDKRPKVVYMAPIKALVSYNFLNFCKLFSVKRKLKNGQRSLEGLV